MEMEAHAKINLFLDVEGLRPDGYHEITSIIAPLTLADRILIEPSPDGELELIAPESVFFEGLPDAARLGPPQENLMYRAAKLLREATGCRAGARLRLEKRIPIAAGLGGGSADAAAVLRGLNQLWKTGLAMNDLAELGGKLGCDIPALLHNGPVIARGRGEIVAPVKWCAGWRPWLLLVNPGFGISTGDVYRRHKSLTSKAEKARLSRLLAAVEAGDAAAAADNLFNALQRTVFEKYPLLRLLSEQLAAVAQSAAWLSGSGATLFALVPDAAQGRAMVAALRKAVDYPLWADVTQTIGAACPA